MDPHIRKKPEQNSNLKLTVKNDSKKKNANLHISKVIWHLQQSRHLRLEEEVENWVKEYIYRSKASRTESNPLPMIIFCIEHEINCDNCGANGHQGEYRIHQQHKSIDVIKLVGPKRCENEIHFDKYGTKRKHSSSWYNKYRTAIPDCGWDGTRNTINTTWWVVFTNPMPSKYCAHNSERKGDKRPNGNHLHYNRKRNCAYSVIINCDGVQNCCHHTNQTWKQ